MPILLLLKSCYSVGYNYQVHRCIDRLAAMNINNVANCFPIFVIFSSMLVIYTEWQMVAHSDCVTSLLILRTTAVSVKIGAFVTVRAGKKTMVKINREMPRPTCTKTSFPLYRFEQ